MIENKKILVLGMARSGYYVTKLLADKNELVVTDLKEQSSEIIDELQNLNVKVIITDSPEELLDETYDLLVKNPGISNTHPCVKKAELLNIAVVNEMEVAYNYIPQDTFVIGITGSNGKTTTTTMIYDLLKLHGKEVVLGGNIGFPLSQIVKDIKKNSILVLEISDHQLANMTNFKTNLSVLTNICATHLDFHGSYEAYKMVKKKIFNNHTEDDIAIINASYNECVELTSDIASKKVYFNNDINYYNNDGVYINNELVLNMIDILIKGNHNYENIVCALSVLNIFGIDKTIVKNYFQTFNGVEHRVENVSVKRNITVYNDSKATNPTSTLIALKTMDTKIHLILGGKERSQDFSELNEEINKVKCIYAIGEVTNRVLEYAKSVNIACVPCYTLENAILEIAKNIIDGETILLSPASASWDQYDKFETRGEEFKKLVEKNFN